MHVHLPKPLHGWREFAGEVGIIVIGVLIALGAEQVVETIHLRQEALGAEQRIKDELAGNSAEEVERLAVAPCLTARVASISSGLASGKADWTAMLFPNNPGMPTALREVYHMPTRPWIADAYHEALSQGDLNSVEPSKRAQLAALYKQIDILAESNGEEQRIVTELAPLQFNRPLSDNERNRMIAVLARLDQLNGLIVLVSRQNLSSLYTLQYAVRRGELFDPVGKVDGWTNELSGLRARYGKCVDQSAIEQYETLALKGGKTA